MVDVFNQSKRSDVMSRIRSSGNRETELALIAVFRRSQVTGWRRHQVIEGRPDFVFKAAKVAVFADGCFWHGCPRCFRPPKSNQEYWGAKIARNRKRDRTVNRNLRKNGWTVIRIWHHTIASNDAARQIGFLKRLLAKSNRAS